MVGRFSNLWKEQFSFAHLHALAAQAGCGIQSFNVDTDSVDAQVFRPGLNSMGVARPVVDVQLKCTTRLFRDSDGLPHFDLSLKNYDELRDERRYVPRLLAVLEVPIDQHDWIHCSDREICLRHRAYWADLLGEGEADSRSSVRVSLPRHLDPDSLGHIMDKLKHDGTWK